MFVRLTMALSRPFKEGHLAIDGVMSLALCPQVVSQASLHFRSSEKQAIVRAALPARLSARSFPFTPACQPTGVFEGGCQPSTHSSLGFPFHFHGDNMCRNSVRLKSRRQECTESVRERRTALYKSHQQQLSSSPSLISLMVSVDVKHHVYFLSSS